MTVLLAVWIGLILDGLCGDPQALPHPVRLIGRFIAWGERFLRRAGCKTPRGCLMGGALLSLCTAGLALVIPFVLLSVLSHVGWCWALALESLFCYQMIAAKDLRDESMAVYAALRQGNLPLARKRLSRIVGRDTEHLDAEHCVRAAVETVAENASDGVTAPLFYLLIGGAPLGFFYKAVNTLDSMIGYQNAQYRYFGRFAARLDDVCNFLPARLTGWCMVLASGIVGLDRKGAARIFRRDRLKHHSPNAAHTEAACAGALGVELAGDSTYFGKLVHKPTIGDAGRPIEVEDIRRANRLMIATAVLFLVLGTVIRLGVLCWIGGWKWN